MSARRWLVAAAAAASVSACGSTVQYSSVATVDGSQAGTTELGQPSTATQPGSAPGVTPTSGSSTPIAGPAPSAAGGGSASGGLDTGAEVPQGLPVGASGRGFTATKIYIGMADVDVNSYAQTLGLNGVATGNIKAQAAAVAADINKHGGLLGRQIELVWFDASTAQELNDAQTSHQAACAAWTQDHHVFAVVGPFGTGTDDILLACLARSGTPLVGALAPWGLDASPFFWETYDRYPTFVNVGAMLGDTFYRIAMKRMVDRGFFQGWNTTTAAPGPAPVKVGVVVQDTPNGNRSLKAIVTNLALHGITPTDVVKLSGDLSARQAQGQSAVLRFRRDGITHVINPVAMRTADAQGYYPRYFIPNEPQIIAANASAKQLRGSMGESYLPAVDAAEQPGPQPAVTTQCLKIMRDAGQDVSWGTVQYTMTSVCDGLYFLQHAVQQAGALSTQSLLAGFEALGSRFPSAVTWSTFLGPRQHASAASLRDLSFVENCTCYRYDNARNWS